MATRMERIKEGHYKNQEAMLKENGTVKIVNIPSVAIKQMINKIIDWEWLR